MQRSHFVPPSRSELARSPPPARFEAPGSFQRKSFLFPLNEQQKVLVRAQEHGPPEACSDLMSQKKNWAKITSQNVQAVAVTQATISCRYWQFRFPNVKKNNQPCLFGQSWEAGTITCNVMFATWHAKNWHKTVSAIITSSWPPKYISSYFNFGIFQCKKIKLCSY